MKKAYVATVHLLLPLDVDSEAAACDAVSGLLSENGTHAGALLDWTYSPGAAASYVGPREVSIPDDFEPEDGTLSAIAETDKTRAALEAAEHWLAEEAASPHPCQTRPDEILRVIREALGKPHDAPDAAPAAPQAPAPVIGPHHGPELSEQLRLARALIGTDDAQGRQEARACIDRAAHASALMLAALREVAAWDDATLGDFLKPSVNKSVRAAIRAAEGREG